MKASPRHLAASLFLSLLLVAPLSTSAANVFGGKISVAIPCFNAAIWTRVSDPRGGLYIWTIGTKTYPYGPPGSGRYTLGLYGVPYFCIVLIAPLFVLPGIAEVMEASSH